MLIKILVSIPEEDSVRLRQLAEEACRSRSGYIRRLIALYLQHIEQHPEARIK